MSGFLPGPWILQGKGKTEENRRRKVLCGKNIKKDQWGRSGAYPGKERYPEEKTTSEKASGKDINIKGIFRWIPLYLYLFTGSVSGVWTGYLSEGGRNAKRKTGIFIMDFFVFFWSAGTQFFKDPVKGLLAVVPALHCYIGDAQICI